MTSYAFWNNKGGVGKSFLCFVAASEYAHRHPESDVYVIDLCPQANVSETLMGGGAGSIPHMRKALNATPRATVAGYLEARLNSPFVTIPDVSPFISHVHQLNSSIPRNLFLVCGDNLLEIISEAIRQTSQLVIPTDAWKLVVSWIRDLKNALKVRSGSRDSLFILDCNPSFAIYTQLAVVAADNLVVPFTADDSSRRGIENVIALLFGVGDSHASLYSKISFEKRAKEEGVSTPKLHTFVSNRVTQYRGRASSAFEAVSKTIRTTMDTIYKSHRGVFADPKEEPSKSFVEVPDYHSACIVASTTGTPLHRLKPGPRIVGTERVQLNKEPLERYTEALEKFVDRL